MKNNETFFFLLIRELKIEFQNYDINSSVKLFVSVIVETLSFNIVVSNLSPFKVFDALFCFSLSQSQCR